MKKIRIIILINFLLFFQFSLFSQDHQSKNSYLTSDSLDQNILKSNCQKIDSIIKFALAQQGKRYKYGTFGPNTFDCSGLMYYTFNHFNIPIGRSSRDQYLNGVKIDIKDIKPGDLVFFYRGKRSRNYIGHVGLVIDVDTLKNFTFVHASTPKTGVRIDHSDRPGYANTFVGARRIVACSEYTHSFPVLKQSDQNEIKSTPTSGTENTTPKSTSKQKKYTVKQGDTLYGISKKYKIPIEKIQKANKLKTDKIFPGQKLIIKS